MISGLIITSPSLLTLRMDPDTSEWIHDILNNVSSMKGVCKSITVYNDMIKHTINALGRRLERMEMDEENVNEGDATYANENNVSYYTNCARVEYTLSKFFPYYGWFDGKVVRIIPIMDKSIHIRYNEGGVEDVTYDKLDTIANANSIGIDEIGFKFTKTIGGDNISGVVARILENKRHICKFNDREHRHYSLTQLVDFEKNRGEMEAEPEDDEMEYEEEEMGEPVEFDDDRDDEENEV